MASSENLTVMFTDIVNYTRITARQSRAESEGMLRQHDSVLLPIVSSYGGQKVKSIGDSLMIKFRSPTDAVHCGMAMQDALADGRSNGTITKALHIRVAINLGEVRVVRHDLFGEPVNVAARLESITPGDEVYFSEAVYLAMNKAEVPAEALGPQELKGIPEAINVYRVPSFTLHRLIPASESRSEHLQTLPFAGMHTRRKPKPQLHQMPARLISYLRQQLFMLIENRDRRRRALFIGVPAVLLVIALGGLLILRMPPVVEAWESIDLAGESVAAEEQFESDGVIQATAESASDETDRPVRGWPFLEQGEKLLRSGNVDQVRAMLSSQFASRPDDPEALLLKGHLAFVAGNYSGGAAAYRKALEQVPELIQNEIMAGNLVASLGYVSGEVRPLLLKFKSRATLDALSLRSGQEGYHGRSQAVSILRALGHGELIDRFNHARQELLGRSDCQDRLVAVKSLRKLGDPAATELLREQITGLRNWWRNACLRDEARATIRELEARKS